MYHKCHSQHFCGFTLLCRWEHCAAKCTMYNCSPSLDIVQCECHMHLCLFPVYWSLFMNLCFAKKNRRFLRTDFNFQVSREVFFFWIGVLTATEDSLFPILEYSQVKKYCILGYLLPIFSTLNNAKEFSFMCVRFSSFTQKNSYIYPSDKKCCIPYLLRSHSGFLCFHQKLQIGKDKKPFVSILLHNLNFRFKLQ